MEFLVTTFLYPLSEPIVLSKKLGFSLDNPRTEYEIEGIRSYLLRAYESGYDYKFPICSDEPIVTLESILLQFRDTLSKEDTYVDQMFVHYEQANIFDFLARIWVIARFEDEGIGETLRSEHRRMLEEGTRGFFMLEDDHPLVKNVENLANYCYLFSLLMHTEKESYFGRTFLIDPKIIDSNRPVQKVWQEYFMFGVASHSYPQSQDELRWIFLPYVRQSIIHLSQLLEQGFEEGLTEKLLYIGSILKIVGHDISDIKTRIVMLTSIIELLLTHNPDFSRFNVEDSINK
ncbi:hypothetical protein [Nostoc commune]|uniref:hypothetical protein n=1 Tax=Nostoc commune TaxID=1178 RepID=UPI0018C6C892|nr:hypothetical protein [Nostoc commune]MBG1260672.1 hypothetical protein [Nostoc commune BAE]